jgi:hypothetical protein
MWRLYPEEIPPLQLQQLITQKHTQQGPVDGAFVFLRLQFAQTPSCYFPTDVLELV